MVPWRDRPSESGHIPSSGDSTNPPPARAEFTRYTERYSLCDNLRVPVDGSHYTNPPTKGTSILRRFIFTFAGVFICLLALQGMTGMTPSATCQPPFCDEEQVCRRPSECSIACFGGCTGKPWKDGHCLNRPNHD